jgi:hypothetical protein
MKHTVQNHAKETVFAWKGYGKPRKISEQPSFWPKFEPETSPNMEQEC